MQHSGKQVPANAYPVPTNAYNVVNYMLAKLNYQMSKSDFFFFWLGYVQYILCTRTHTYLLNIRWYPGEKIQKLIIVNGIWVSKLLCKFIDACEEKSI